MRTAYLAALLCLIASAPVWARNWRDASGKFSLEAELLEFKGGIVKLKKQDGKVIEMALEKLSEEDRKFLRHQAAPATPRAKTPAAPKEAPTVSFDERLKQTISEEHSDKTYVEWVRLFEAQFERSVFISSEWLAISNLELTQKVAPQVADAAGNSASIGKTWLDRLEYVSRGNWSDSGGMITFSKPRLQTVIYRIRKEAELLNDDALVEDVMKIAATTWADLGGQGVVVRLRTVLLISQSAAIHFQIRQQFKDRLQPVTEANKWLLPPLRRELAANWSALQTKADVEVFELPLDRAIDSFVKGTPLKVSWDEQGLQQAGISRTMPVTFKLRGQPLGRALEELLLQHHLGIKVEEKQLVITSQEVLGYAMFEADYDVGFIVLDVRSGQIIADFDSVIDAVTSVVRPGSWIDNGGLGSINGEPRAASLRIRQTYNNHMEIATIIQGLRRLNSGDIEIAKEPNEKTSALQRTRWNFAGGHFLLKDGKKQWVEMVDVKENAVFAETRRNANYVELYDKSRDIGVRLYAGKMYLKQPGKKNYDLFKGGDWAE